jgi:hypothetical protein
LKKTFVPLTVVLLLLVELSLSARQLDKADTLEQRQALEMVFADSIVPQDRHEMMLTTGAWYSRSGSLHEVMLTQKVEWGITEKSQISGFSNPVHNSNSSGEGVTGMGDFELGARYTWTDVGSRFTHIALTVDAGFPSGDPLTGMGEGAYGFSPAVLLSHEIRGGRYHAFTTTGFDFVLARRQANAPDDISHHVVFVNSGFAARVGSGWTVGEVSFNSNRWSGGDITNVLVTPSYVWRLARRSELLVGLPVGLTSSADNIGAVVKFTFELGGSKE